MKKSTMLAGGLVVAAIGAAAAGWWWHRQVSRVEDAVRTRLVAPASARFSRVSYDPRTHTGCGFVDAKTLDGRNVGSAPFVLDPDGNVDILRAHPDAADAQQREDNDSEDRRYRQAKAKFCAGV